MTQSLITRTGASSTSIPPGTYSAVITDITPFTGIDYFTKKPCRRLLITWRITDPSNYLGRTVDRHMADSPHERSIFHSIFRTITGEAPADDVERGPASTLIGRPHRIVIEQRDGLLDHEFRCVVGSCLPATE